MAGKYEKLYAEQKHALGEPTKEYVKFFADYAKENANILDVGCGQGRDAIFIAKLGHRVVGIDNSATGIKDLLADASRLGINIEGHVSDVQSFDTHELFDVIVIDRTLHMLEENARVAALAKLIKSVANAGHILIADEKSNMPVFEQVFADDLRTWISTIQYRGFLFMQHIGKSGS